MSTRLVLLFSLWYSWPQENLFQKIPLGIVSAAVFSSSNKVYLKIVSTMVDTGKLGCGGSNNSFTFLAGHEFVNRCLLAGQRNSFTVPLCSSATENSERHFLFFVLSIYIQEQNI